MPNLFLIILIFLLLLSTLRLLFQLKREVYYKSLPKDLKNINGNFNISKKIIRRIENLNKYLIKTTKSNFFKDKKIKKILENIEISEYIEKFVYVYFDDFTDEISDQTLDWNNENTKLFFGLLEHKYKLTNRSLLKTILYLRHEIEYFNYKETLSLKKPKSLEELYEQTVKYSLINEKENIELENVKRASCEFGFGLPFFSIRNSLSKTEKRMELLYFDQSFKKNEDRVKESSSERLKIISWEDILKLGLNEGIDISEESYIIESQDYSRDSRLDRYFKNHLGFALIQHFKRKCVKCSVEDKLEFDHFWLPKSKGGNFVMRSKKGIYINNCIPLCRSCNASKGAKYLWEYFNDEEMKNLLKTSNKFNSFLNSHLHSFKGNFLLSTKAA